MESLLSLVGNLWLGQPIWMWLVFLVSVVTLLAFDLGILSSKRKSEIESNPQEGMGVSQSLKLSGFYIAAAVLFGVWVWMTLGQQSGMEYFTGFALEKALALDNVFVISIIFGALAIPRAYQHRVLFWGILGVILLRGIMIGLGTALVSQFNWVMWIFALFLIFTGVKLIFNKDDNDPNVSNLEKHPLVKLLGRFVPITSQLQGQKFLAHLPDATGKMRLHATPLLIALVLVEAADLIFAVDSIPAIFAITKDPFIVYTSNIFAVLGLRALYFALEALIHRFATLQTALSLILIFIGGKVIYSQMFSKVDAAISLGVTLALLSGGIIWGLLKKPEPQPEARD